MKRHAFQSVISPESISAPDQSYSQEQRERPPRPTPEAISTSPSLSTVGSKSCSPWRPRFGPAHPVRATFDDNEEVRDDLPSTAGGTYELSTIDDLISANQQKEQQLQSLHDKFLNIQQGLGSIDQERNLLFEKSGQLESEKRQIKRQLILREKEILALVKRCTSQEEKMKESSKLRAQNRELSQALDSVRNKLHNLEEEQESLISLRNQLQESELAREELQDRLAKIEREHNAITDTLQECLAKVKKLTDEKHKVEEERRRERRRAEIELEKQRLVHVQASNHLKIDLETQQARILQMERILQDNMATNTALRREKALTTQAQQEKMQKIVDRYEEKVASLKAQIDESSINNEEEYRQALIEMHAMLEEKNVVMLELEMQFGEQMEELMSKQSELDRLHEEKKALEERVSFLKNLEHQHSALLDFVQIADSNIVDLTSENASLNVEKDSLRDETTELINKVNRLEDQLNRFQEHRKAREEDFHALLDAEKEELRIEQKGSLVSAQEEVTSLEEELETRNDTIASLESELQEIRESVVDKENKIITLEEEKEELRIQLEDALEKAQKRVETLESELSSKDQELSLELQTAHETIANKDIRIKTIEEMCAEKEEEGTELASSTQDANAKVESLELELSSTEDENSALAQQVETLKSSLAAQDSRLQKAKVESEEKGHLMQSLQEEREEILKLQPQLEMSEEQISSWRVACSSLESQLEDANQALVERDAEIKILEGKRAENSDLLRSFKEEQSDKDKIRSELKSSLADARNEAIDFQEQFQSLSEKHAQLKKDLGSSNESLAERKRHIHKIETKLKDKDQDRSGLMNALSKAKDEVVSLTKQLSSGSDTFSELESELQKTHTTLCEARQRIKAIEEQHGETTKLLSDREGQLNDAYEKVADLQDDISSWNEKNISLQCELKCAHDSLAERERRIHSIEEDGTQKQVKLDSSVNTLEEELASTKGLLSDRESRMKIVETESTEKDELRSKLERTLLEANMKLAVLEDEILAWEKQYSSLEQRLKVANQSAAEKDTSIQKSQEERLESDRQRSIIEQASRAESEELRAKLESVQALLESREESLLSVDEDLEVARRTTHEKESRLTAVQDENSQYKDDLSDANAKIESLEKLLESREDRLLSLDEEVDIAKHVLVEKEAHACTLEEQSKKEKEEASFKVLELEEKLRGKRKTIEHLQKKYEDKDAAIGLLQMQIQEAYQEIEDHGNTSQEEISKLEAQVRKMTTDIALKGDEIRELRLVELKDAEETVASLRTELSVVRQERSEKESKATRLVDDLKAETADWKCQSDEFQQQASEMRKQHCEDTDTISRLEEQRTKCEAQIAEQDSMLEERHASITSLTTQQTILEQNESAIRTECDQLLKAEKIAQADITKLTNALDFAIKREREDKEIKLQQKEVAHQKELQALETRMLSIEETLRESEVTLQERSSLLADMVEHNKHLESRMDEEQARVSELEESGNRGQIELAVKQVELTRIRRDLREKEDSLAEIINEERTHREIAEAELAKVKTRFQSMTKTAVADLEKENTALKDKIRRQEAFLERKLQKEKVLRDRTVRNKSVSPKKQGGASNRSKMRRPSAAQSTCSEVSSIPHSETTHLYAMSKIESEEVPDWELES
jgi:chromosome segregation ATPase